MSNSEINTDQFNICSRLLNNLLPAFESQYIKQNFSFNKETVINYLENFNKMIVFFCCSVSNNLDQLEQEWILECLGEFVGFMIGKNNKEGPLDFFSAHRNEHKMEELYMDNRPILLVDILFKMNHYRNNAAHSYDYSNFHHVKAILLKNTTVIKDVVEDLIYEAENFNTQMTARMSCCMGFNILSFVT